MNLNVGPVCTYFITFGLHMLRKQAVFCASIHENLRLAELMYEGYIDYYELHDKLICFASHFYNPYSIHIDSKPSVNTQIS